VYIILYIIMIYYYI